MTRLVRHGLAHLKAVQGAAARIDLSWVRIEFVLLTGALILAG
jgi:hypothetical protein